VSGNNKILKDMTVSEILGHIKDIKKEMMGLRFQFALGGNTGINKVRLLRKEVARAMTEIRRRANK